jgi:hypothetical protein
MIKYKSDEKDNIVSKPDDRVLSTRGKSGLHRVGRWITPSRGNPKDSATERDRPTFNFNILLKNGLLKLNVG